MANISTLVVNASYEALTSDISYTLVRCEARPLTAWLAPAHLALLADVTATAEEERALALAVERAEVLLFLADEDIDGTVDAIVNTLLLITGMDRDDDLYTHFMGNKTPWSLKEPILGEELETVRSWIPSLQSSPYPTLVAFGPVLAQQVDAADAVKAKLAAATQALKDFREVGARKALVDTINARRKATHGELGEIAHSHPELRLPSDFADRFFLRERRWKKPTSKELEARLQVAKAAVADLEVRLARAEAEEKAEADQAAEQKEKALAKKIAAAQKKADAAAQALADLKGA